MQISSISSLSPQGLSGLSPAGGFPFCGKPSAPAEVTPQIMQIVGALMQRMQSEGGLLGAGKFGDSSKSEKGTNPADSINSFLGGASNRGASGNGATGRSMSRSGAGRAPAGAARVSSSGGGQTVNRSRSADRAGGSAVDLARRFLNRRSQSIRGEMPNFTAAGGSTNNCADFVSAALRSTGNMSGSHIVGVQALETRLRQQGWRQVPRDQAGPGDVAFFPNRRHVQLCSGNGQQIGSNNNRQSFQTITEGRLASNAVVYTRR